MSAKIKYTDEPIGPLKVVPDFLPSPEQLAFKKDTAKITITLSKESVELFKQEAKRHHIQYEKDTVVTGCLYAGTQATSSKAIQPAHQGA